MAETATEPKTILPAIFQKRVGGKNKHIRKLVIDEETVTTPSRILEEEKSLYKQLYTESCSSEDLSCDQNKLLYDLPRLSDKNLKYCEKPISIEEVTFSLQQLSANKTPGSAGFTAEFYKYFWP